MTILTRRGALAAGTAFGLARPAIVRAEDRPAVTVAVQKIANSNTLEPLREQSNVGERVFLTSLWEGLIGRNYQGRLENQPMLATSWRRIDERVVEFKLREGVKFHNGDVMTAEDVAFSFGPERMFGPEGLQPGAQGKTLFTAETNPGRAGKELPPEVPAVARRMLPGLEKVEIVDYH